MGVKFKDEFDRRMTDLADVIRDKSGEIDKLSIEEMTEAVKSISTVEYDGETYEGPYTIRPEIDEQIMETNNKLMTDDVTIQAIPYHSVDNAEMGQTVIIGGVDVYGRE